ncbi:Imm8 family immunity protein [Carnimonas bestiolae]
MKKAITNQINKCEGNDWGEVAEKLSRMIFWEFEDFIEFSE